jgi:hypothetical protein
MRVVRSSSVGAWSESASFTCSGSLASRSMPGTQPAVEIAIERAARAKPSRSFSARHAASTAS